MKAHALPSVAVALIVAVLCGCGVSPQPATRSIAKGGRDIVYVCKRGGTVPDGYVITEDTYVSDCYQQGDPLGMHNAWSCKKPDPNGETICKETPNIPTGFVIIAEGIALCPHAAGVKNGWIIKKATADRELVCNCSPIPPGYRETGQHDTLGDCPPEYDEHHQPKPNAKYLEKIPPTTQP